jgi:3'-phosphoadenosine 5'-phosphosulfate sulfotransferase (PAPS reductase)/FAD synthetase
LYAKGHKRVGCYPCLLANNNEWQMAAQDPVGRQNIKKLIAIEDKFILEKNPRKMIKIHPTEKCASPA